MKKIVVFIVVLFPFLVFSGKISAADKSVICNSSSCSGFEGSLFSELDLKPGDNYTKSFCITNERGENLSVELFGNVKPGSDKSFNQVLNVVMENAAQVNLFQGTLYEFLEADISLGIVDEDKQNCFEISVSIPKEVGNDYQGKTVNFDLVLKFTGEESGEEEVLSSSTSCSDSESCETSTDVKSILGEVLGLSDTSGIGEWIKVNLYYVLLGLLFIGFGVKLIRKNYS